MATYIYSSTVHKWRTTSQVQDRDQAGLSLSSLNVMIVDVLLCNFAYLGWRLVASLIDRYT